MSQALVLVCYLLVGINCQQLRTRDPGEIVPTSVEQSDTTETGIADGFAAVDLDFSTSALAKPINGTSAWLKLKFDKLYCISLIVRFNNDARIRQFYACTNAAAGCNCTGANCQFTKDIVVESPGVDTSSVPDMVPCKYGNMIQLQAKSNTSSPSFPELAVYGTVVCPAGSYRISEEECESCPEDEYSEAGAATCTKCPPGTVANENRTECEIEMCKAGSAKNSEMLKCSECSEDSVSAAGAVTCIKCPPGTVANENQTECEMCKAGTAKNSEMIMCTECSGNSISAPGAASCVPCSPGFTANRNKTGCDRSFHSKIPEPILLGLLGLFILISTTLGILLVWKYNCATSNTAKDEPTPPAYTSVNEDLQPDPNNNDAALKS